MQVRSLSSQAAVLVISWASPCDFLATFPQMTAPGWSCLGSEIKQDQTWLVLEQEIIQEYQGCGLDWEVEELAKIDKWYSNQLLYYLQRKNVASGILSCWQKSKWLLFFFLWCFLCLKAASLFLAAPYRRRIYSSKSLVKANWHLPNWTVFCCNGEKKNCLDLWQ